MSSFAGMFRRTKRSIATENHVSSPDSQPNSETVVIQAVRNGTSSTLLFPDGVEVLHDCPDAVVDLCFVHGLTGNRDATWTAHGQQTPWPQSLLPTRLPKARILTYGYDAYILRKSVASSNRLIDHAMNLLTDLTTDRAQSQAVSRPLIFIAHSLGGLVCKEAILQSRNNPEAHLREVFNCTRGIIFMGTPHRGSWMADWAKIPAQAIGLVKSTNKSLLAILETNSQFLESIQTRFWAMVRELRESGRRLEVTCFFEELPMHMGGKIVSKESATLEGYSSISIHGNHSDMVKFGSVEDNGFKRLVGELVRWESQIRAGNKLDELRDHPQQGRDPETPRHVFLNHGTGTMNVQAGAGTQNNNNSNGIQMIGGVIHDFHTSL